MKFAVRNDPPWYEFIDWVLSRGVYFCRNEKFSRVYKEEGSRVGLKSVKIE